MRPTGQAWRSHVTNGQQNKPGTTDPFNQPFDIYSCQTDLLLGHLTVLDLFYGHDDMLE